MTKNNKKGLIFCKLEPPKLEDIKIELEDIKIELEGLIGVHGLVFDVMDEKITEEGLRNKKDKETISILKTYDEIRKGFYKKINGENEGK